VRRLAGVIGLVVFGLLLTMGGGRWTASLAWAEVTVGQQAPEFSLTDLDGKTRSLSEFAGTYRVLEWTNYDCPFVVKHYGSGNMPALQKEYTAKGVTWLSVNSSASGKQGHFSIDEWRQRMQANGAAPSAVLLDPDGQVGQLYGAKTTPHIFIIDPQGVLIYQGAIDDIPSADQDDIAKATNYVRATLDAAMAGQPVVTTSTKSYGCSVKY